MGMDNGRENHESEGRTGICCFERLETCSGHSPSVYQMSVSSSSFSSGRFERNFKRNELVFLKIMKGSGFFVGFCWFLSVFLSVFGLFLQIKFPYKLFNTSKTHFFRRHRQKTSF